MEAVERSFYGLLIGGEEREATGAEKHTLLNPATNRPLAETAVAHTEDARHAMEVAETAFRESGWAGDDGARRVRVLSKLASLLEQHRDSFARLETLNMGKPLRESRGDIGYTVRTLEYVAGLADKLEGETIPVPGARFDYTVVEPLGVTVHIAPWNYPLLLSIRSVAPALAAGNAVVLKPASLTPLTAIAFGQLAKEAGVPPGIFNVVAGNGSEVGEALVTDPRCRSVSFTGSGPVGQRIAELAARRVIPVTLELGGKSPVVVFSDADVERAAKGVIYGIFGNAGQMCWAASRLIVQSEIREKLLERVVHLARALKLGPGTQDGVEMGPLVSAEHAERVLRFIGEAKEQGAKVVTGGGKPSESSLAEGNFVEPTVIADPDPKARVVQEEVFGPVLVVASFGGVDEAVRLANDTRYGLLAALWTQDLRRAHSVASSLEAGMVSINEAPNTFPQTPFGGFKESGVGFEQGRRALDPFTRRKNVLVNLATPKK